MHEGTNSLMTVTVSCVLLVAPVVAQRGIGTELKMAATTSLQAPITPGDSKRSITVGGLERTYILHIPPGYDGSTPLPLVFVLHGSGGHAKGFEQVTGMSAKADAENFIAVYPNADGNPTRWNIGWGVNAGTADDVGFVRALLDRLEHDLRLDPRRIYCCGLSGGAMMTYRLGAELSDRLAAIGVAAGSIGTRPPGGPVAMIASPSHPVPVITFHGKQDRTVYYDGGGFFAGQTTYVFSVRESIAFWVKHDGCASPPQETNRQNGNLIIDDYDRCQGANEVVLYTFLNGTHEWPKLQNNDHFSATDAMWEFFVRHPKQ
jgi:polyhydroxybutyrate depolymerase